MIFLKKCMFVFLFVLFAIPGARAESLSEAVGAAFTTHPSVEAAKAAIKSADETRVEQLSGFFPELSLSSTAGRIFGDNSTSRGLSVTRGEGYSGIWDGSFTARQMIFDGFETSSRLNSAELRLESANYTFLDVREQLAFRTLQAYIEVMQAYEGLTMLRVHEEKVADYLGRIRLSVDEGTADESQLQQGRDIKVILDSFITDYEARVSAAEASYLELTGHLPEGSMNVPGLDSSLFPSSVHDAIARVKDSHPSLRAAKFGVDAAEHEITSERAQLYPDLSGELSYLKSDKRDILGGEAEDARAVVRMNWSFETGGAQFARIARSKQDYLQAQSRAKELQRQIETQVRLAYNELKTARVQSRNQQQRVELNEKLFETYEVQFEGARISLVQLMQADNQVFNTQLEKMLGEYRILAAEYGLLASLGQLQSALGLEQEVTSYE